MWPDERTSVSCPDQIVTVNTNYRGGGCQDEVQYGGSDLSQINKTKQTTTKKLGKPVRNNAEVRL